MIGLQKHMDWATLLVMSITLVLFVAAVFFKGLTHDLLLEAGVFLVSVKLIIMSYKNSIAAVRLQERVEDIHSMLERLEKRTIQMPDNGESKT